MANVMDQDRDRWIGRNQFGTSGGCDTHNRVGCERCLIVGDTVQWRGAFGAEAPRLARVTALEHTEQPRQKYGTPAVSAPWVMVQENRVVVTLDNGTWAYGSQLAPAVDRRAV